MFSFLITDASGLEWKPKKIMHLNHLKSKTENGSAVIKALKSTSITIWSSVVVCSHQNQHLSFFVHTLYRNSKKNINYPIVKNTINFEQGQLKYSCAVSSIYVAMNVNRGDQIETRISNNSLSNINIDNSYWGVIEI